MAFGFDRNTQIYDSRVTEEFYIKLLLSFVLIGIPLSPLPNFLVTHYSIKDVIHFWKGKKMNPTAFLFNNCSATKFYWYPFMFPLEDVMHKSIATEHIKLQMKFIVKSRMSPRQVSVFIFIHKTKPKKIADIIYSFVSKFMGVNCHPTLLTDIRQILKRQLKFTLRDINCSTKAL